MMLEELVMPMRAETNLFKSGVMAAAAVVAALVAGMGMAIKASFQWADELDQIGDVIGGTAEQLATYNFVLRKSGVDTASFTQAMVIMEKGLVTNKGKLDTVGKALKAYGINALDVNGKVKDQSVLIAEVADRYSKFTTQQERVNFLTEVFGRSGAGLIDFFDTLAKEGGIDAATKKVKEFGLVIDPDKYEQYNRNLQELKMIGLALAIAFTEKVMPVLESAVKWLMSLRNDPKVVAFLANAEKAVDSFWNNPNVQAVLKFFSKTMVDIGGGRSIAMGPSPFETMLEKWKEGLKNFDSAQFAQDAIDFGKNIDWVTISDNLIAGIESIDWDAVGTSLGEGLDVVLDVVGGIALGIYEGIKGAIEQVDWFELFSVISVAAYSVLNNMSGGTVAVIFGMFANWISTAITKFGEFKAAIEGEFSKLIQTIHNWLVAIGIQFTLGAGAWISNAWSSLSLKLAGFYGFLQRIVDTINSILSNIMNVEISLPFGLGGTGGGSTGGRPASRHASGGAVIGGQPIMVGELRPELFVPSTSGQIVPNPQPTTVNVDIDYKKLARVIRDANLQAA